MVEVEHLAFENAFPLRIGDSGRGSSNGSDEELATGDVLSVDVETIERFTTAEGERTQGGFVVVVCPAQVGVREFLLLVRTFLGFD